jgi:hypothetical protein
LRDTLSIPCFSELCSQSISRLCPSSLIEAPDPFRLIQRRRHAEADTIIDSRAP